MSKGRLLQLDTMLCVKDELFGRIARHRGATR
jgi:hypothetical protein